MWNKDEMNGKMDQVKGKARQAWGDLTDDDLDVAELIDLGEELVEEAARLGDGLVHLPVGRDDRPPRAHAASSALSCDSTIST